MAKVVVKESQPIHMYYLEFSGPFPAAGEKINEVIEWVQAHGGVTCSQPYIIHLDNPGPAMMEHWQGELGIDAMPEGYSGSRKLAVAAPVKVKEIAPQTVAALEYQGPLPGLMDASQELLAWIPANGYEQVGPFREVHLEEPRVEGDMLFPHEELQVPVKLKAAKQARKKGAKKATKKVGKK